MSESIKLNIRPTTKTYAFFTNLSYQEEFALAEFIDNSTASYYLHKDILNEEARSHKVTIIINYDSIADVLTIRDDAFGMEIEEFKNAILLDSVPLVSGGRNEFGYGLKTAATWFGRHWEVRSSMYGSENGYCASLDIDEIINNDIDEIEIHPFEEKYDSHYTVITISKLNRQLKTKNIKNTIIKTLQSFYRRDINSGQVEIIYDGRTIVPKELPILRNFRGQDWSRDFHVSFVFNDKVYNAKGKVEILESGHYNETGFALFRRDRVVVDHYKPKAIFVQSQSPISLKLLGEIDMDDFPIAQAKNQLAWSAELEELFVRKLKETIQDYITVASYSYTDIKKEQEGLSTAVDPKTKKRDKSKQKKSDEIVSSKTDSPVNTGTNEGQKNINNEVKDENNTSSTELKDNKNKMIVAGQRSYYLKYDNSIYTFVWETDLNSSVLFKYDKNLKIVNVYMPNKYNSGNRGSETMTSMIILSYIISEERCIHYQDKEGKIPIALINNQLNSIIEQIEVVENE